MGMNNRLVNIGIPTLHCYNRLAGLIQKLDADDSAPLDLAFTVIDNGGKLTSSQWMEPLNSVKSEIALVIPDRNLGVATSFNWFVRRLGQCFIANDDISITKHDLSLMLEGADQNPDSVFIGNQEGGWTIFWVNRPDTWLSMGGFDEHFYPAYYEDNDAMRRLELANLPRAQVALPGWTHANSSTLHDGSPEYQQAHWVSFHRNARYYCQKWGGLPGMEQYVEPFNGTPQRIMSWQTTGDS